MKVTKIEIKKTLLDLPEGTPIYREAVRNRLEVAYKEGEDISQIPVTAKDLTYDIQKIYSHEGGYEYFAVLLGEDQLFQKLLEISNQKVEQLKDKCREFGFKEGLEEGKKEWARKIKLTSFWWRIKFAFKALIK